MLKGLLQSLTCFRVGQVCHEVYAKRTRWKSQATWEAFLEEGSEYSDEGPMLEHTNVLLRPEQFIQIRRWVLFRRDIEGLADYYSIFCDLPESNLHFGGKGLTINEVERQTNFIEWLYTKMLEEKKTDSELWRYVEGPLAQAKAYKKYRVNGFIFSPKSHDDTVATQDSGVCMEATTIFRASRKDKNPINQVTKWYGVIKQILEMDYTDFVEVVFYCDWVKVKDKNNGCKLCPNSNLVMVNLNRPKSGDKYLDEPVILASEASQVFYSKDLKNPNWWVVIHSPKRLTKQVDNLSIPNPEEFQQLFDDEPHLAHLLQLRC
ncbi:protein of unknown function DUF4216 [Macleaya cordata]|uniref:DUF4216 domain-containing protein n=1 Tax=Macleaya cordata TaxID=56857 RepID=A0A200QN51_MACCD|nr:protein of unknown function DUF4216 [Macleaya cordata]